MAFIGRVIGRLTGRTISEAVGYGIGGAITPAIEPLTQDLRNRSFAAHPSVPLDPQTAALRVVEAPDEEADFAAWAREQGLDERPFTEMVRAAEQAPDFATLLDLWRRGFTDEAELERGLRKLHIAEPFRGALRRLRRVLLTPADLANARQQGFVDEARQRAESELQGLEQADAEIMFELAGLPPGPEAGLVMLRRGIIDEATFARIVREGHTKTKYTEALLALRRQVLSAQEAAAALVKEHLTREQALAIARANGFEEQEFQTLFLTTGRPASPTEMLTLINRGQATREQFRRAIAQSDIRTEYADLLLHLRRHLPPLFQVVRLVKAGAISDELAIRLVVEQGYDREIAEGIVHAGHADKTARSRDLAQGTILTLYQARELPEARSRELLAALGYDENEVGLLLSLEDARREVRFRERAVETVHARFVGGKLAEAEAQSLLDQLGVHPDAKDDLFALWDLERSTLRRQLTEAQIVAAAQRGLIPAADAHGRLLALGYDDGDADLLLAIASTPRPRARRT